MSVRALPWFEQAQRQLWAAMQRAAVAQSLLVSAPAGYGASIFAEQLAAWLLCAQPKPEGPCGACRQCRLRLAGNHPDIKRIGRIENKEGKLALGIGVDQIRDLNFAMSERPQVALQLVAIIDPAERMNRNAANALLKRLEEPISDSYFVLVSERESALPATVLSRCVRLRPSVVASPGGRGLDGLARGPLEAEQWREAKVDTQLARLQQCLSAIAAGKQDVVAASADLSATRNRPEDFALFGRVLLDLALPHPALDHDYSVSMHAALNLAQQAFATARSLERSALRVDLAWLELLLRFDEARV